MNIQNGGELLTLSRVVLNEQRKVKNASGDLTLLLVSIQLGCKFVASKVRMAGLVNLTGLATGGKVNVQGEDVKKLDILANDIFINSLRSSGKVAFMISEENENAIFVDAELSGRYIITFDPLDGSSNIDCGVSIGTIFGIYKLPNEVTKPSLEHVLVPGNAMVAAGYCMYGSSTVMVLSTGNTVNGYTLDDTIGEFLLTHSNIQVKPRGNIYSVNEGNSLYWDEACKKYFHAKKFPTDPSKKPYSARYVGSMVADVHRTFLYGGIFAYPADSKSKKGKLRILYEGFPMAFLMEKAGGKASTGSGRILDITPEHIHDRCPVFMGSKEDVEELEKCYKEVGTTVFELREP